MGDVRRIDGRYRAQRLRAHHEEEDAKPAARTQARTSETSPTTGTRPRPSLQTRGNARGRHDFESNGQNREHVVQQRWDRQQEAGGTDPAPPRAHRAETRLDPSNPAVLAGQLAYLDWQDPAKVRADLKREPNLNQYTGPEVEALAIVAMEHPEARPAIRDAVIETVRSAETLADLPQTPGFQFLLSSQLVDVETDDRIGTMYGALGNLSTMVEEEVSRSFDRNLDGAKGDDEVDRAGERFRADLQVLADQNPALLEQIDEAANEVVSASGDRIQDRRRADDGFFSRINHDVTGGIRGGASALADFVAPRGGPGSPLVGPEWLRSSTAQALSDAGAGFGEQVRGSIEGPALLLTDPGGAARAMVELVKHPSHLLDGYKQIYEEHGANGLAGALGFDMLSAVISFQPIADAFTPLARTGAHLARGLADVVGDAIPGDEFLSALRKSDAFKVLEVDKQATLLRWVDGKEPFISPQMRETVETALRKTDGFDDLAPSEREAMLLRLSMSMPHFVAGGTPVGGPARFAPNAAGVLSRATPTDLDLWTSGGAAVQRTLRVDGRTIRIVSPADEATQYSVDEVAEAIRSMPREARNQLDTVMIESGRMDTAYAVSAPDGIPVVALLSNGEKLSHDQLVMTLTHESGHVMSKDRWGGITSGAEWDEWKEAMRQDQIRASSYAAVDTHEDFAESFSMYYAVKGTEWEAAVRAKLPNRFAILDEFIAAEGSNSPIPLRS